MMGSNYLLRLLDYLKSRFFTLELSSFPWTNPIRNIWRLEKQFLMQGNSKKAYSHSKKQSSSILKTQGLIFFLAKTFWNLRKENECFSAIKKALSLCPQSLNLHNFLIETFEKKQKLQDLESFCDEIAKLIQDPEAVSSFYYENAEVLTRSNKYPQALESYKKAF